MEITTHISEKDIIEAAGYNTFKKGESYYKSGRVVFLDFDETGNIIQGLVQGSKRNPYTVWIPLDDFKENQNGFCSCPLEVSCKHVVATLLAASKTMVILNNSKTPTNFASNKMPLQVEYTLDIGKITEQSTQKTSAFQKWFQLVAVSTNQEVVNNKSVHNLLDLLYILKLQPYGIIPKLIVQLHMARPLKQGGYGKSKPFSFASKAQYLMLKEKDQENLQHLELLYKKNHGINKNELNDFELCGKKSHILLSEIIKTGRCYWGINQSNTLLNHGETKQAEFKWIINNKGEQKLTCFIDGNKMVHVLPTELPWYIDLEKHSCGPLNMTIDPSLVKPLLFAPPVLPEDIAIIHEKIAASTQYENPPLPQQLPVRTYTNIQPKANLQLFGLEMQEHFSMRPSIFPLGRVHFSYENIHTLINGPKILHKYDEINHEFQNIVRDLSAEQKFLNDLTTLGVPLLTHRYQTRRHSVLSPFDFLIGDIDDEESQSDFLYKIVPKLKEKGWDITIENSFPAEYFMPVDEWYTKISETSSNIDWFDMELGIVVEKEKINILPFIIQMMKEMDKDVFKNLDKQKDNHFTLELTGGKKVQIPYKRIHGILSVLTELFDINSLNTAGSLPISRFRASQISALKETLGCEKMHWFGGVKLLQLSKQLSNFQGIRPVTLPAIFKGELRDYQKIGVDWLNFLREYRLGGILCDDMGLGKTVQILAHLAIEKTEGRLLKPCLILAPTSLLENWRKELERFTPSLTTLVLQGKNRQMSFENISTYDIVISSYPLLYRDQKIFLQHDYSFIILDEAQCIKNSNTLAYQTLRQLKGDHRLCLTGTPMENHLGELWSLFNFLAPGFLGNARQFSEIFRTPIERHRDTLRQKSLQQRIRPYLLRRTKEQVLTELPAKTVIIQKIELHDDERELYESIRISMEKKVRETLKQRGLSNSQITILDALLKLRQVCCDFRLLSLSTAKKVQKSAKLSFLIEMLSELIENGRKILLFSSFTSMLELIEEALKNQKIDYVTLTGKTTDRKTPIEQFQTGKVSLFLISLKAGGTGLNLTAADVVIHYDPWWNPAVEAQATDRAHRIGQTKPVFVYKLITTGTVEEKILLLHEQKQYLLAGLLDENKPFEKTKLTAEDLQYLFQPIEAVAQNI